MDLGIKIFQASEHLRMAEDFRERQRVAMEKAVNGEGRSNFKTTRLQQTTLQ